MDLTINALVSQLQNYSDLDFAKDSGFASGDVSDLIQIDNYPFWNVTAAPSDESFEKFSDMAEDEMERHILPVIIQYATRAIEVEVAALGDDNNVGIHAFTKFIWSAVKFDRTLGDVVNGILRPLAVNVTPVAILTESGEVDVFKQGREMFVTFYRDIEV